MGGRLDGVALVTGAGSGIGRSVAIALCLAGVTHLYITDINEEGVSGTSNAIKSVLPQSTTPEITTCLGDISTPEFVAELFSKIEHLDYAVNCAGVLGENKPTAEVSLAEFDRINSINYRGLWMCVKEELKLILKNDVTPYRGFTVTKEEAEIRGQRGAIVNIASQLGIVGKTQASVYTASKAAVLSMTRSDSIDYSKPPHHIRINSICPGVIQTPMTTSEDGKVSERLRDAISIAPMDRMGLPSEIADTAVFLCSGESSFITGTGVVVDGGYIIN
ncbi:2-(R)-hydroxypropyl-CoM dehydrogenase [Lophiostoma macrostomum CBS 122681]|uniref:2-(R)-hydroxypropyl-CoM dehydrogenase n=1 Tax=Lophiostoma macrostomum CBS 122681 TaxID=1314788 RepID=A0A6A6T744_9PLEO|nr:2-(R)-hydroxypropyl-CoM dehydrogenase [Lophiostoma macrostomum CBS 122681]